MSEPARLIQNQSHLEELCQRLEDSQFVAVDTEFVRERTYYPKLCLIQIATDGEVALVDALAELRLEPLVSTLLRPGLDKVLHAARQDLEIFYHLCQQIPCPVFDTQLAAACLGMGEQISYSRLIEMLFDIPPGKSHARTDWTRRPLSAQQTQYAVADVYHLVPAYHELVQSLERSQRTHWVREACDRLADPKLYAPDPDGAYKRVRGAGRLGATERARLQALASWRERVAMRADRPRRWILDDRVLVSLTTLDGSDREALRRTPGLPPSVFRRRGDRLLEILRAVSASDTREGVAEKAKLKASQNKLLKRLSALVRDEAKRLGTSPSMLATRAELIQMITRPDANHALATGWRRELIGEQLLDAISGGTR